MQKRAVLWSSIWLVVVLVAVCASSKHCIDVPLLLPVIFGLGLPAAVLMALRQKRLREMLNQNKR